MHLYIRKEAKKPLKIMKKTFVGKGTYLYTFPLSCEISYKLGMKEMAKKGIVTEVFLDNELGFEVKFFCYS